ncbi:MAG: ATP-dependent 6-phosphofructokinase [Spirochaetaceae bacterium]|nr:MAG: ATP-dependent 6-phosphofructokinase [Spirochaetaceae bacterium]
MGAAIEYVPVDTLGEAAKRSPITNRRQFVRDDTWVRYNVEIGVDAEELAFEKGGPRENIYFDPVDCRAAIVTCGGLAPGLNNVIRSIVTELHFHYGVFSILGIRKGYLGLNPASKLDPISLTPAMVDNIHTEGGTILGSSRGRQDEYVMVDYLRERKINLLFCIGGDGTLRAAAKIAGAARERGVRISVIGIPKTIDNDVFYCDRTFGYSTAVDAARDVLSVAHVEAKGADRGIGLVKLMGRDAGFIACGATVASQQVNYTLIPEVPFELEGPTGFLAHLGKRMDDRDHALIVVAEGAGQNLFPDHELGTDASGNRRYGDIGHLLRDRIKEHFLALERSVEVKYINPSYIIRGVPADSEDSLLCDQLARDAVHAAMAGKTTCLVSFLNNRVVHVPLGRAVGRKKQVDPDGPLWQSVLASTGQPPVFS